MRCGDLPFSRSNSALAKCSKSDGVSMSVTATAAQVRGGRSTRADQAVCNAGSARSIGGCCASVCRATTRANALWRMSRLVANVTTCGSAPNVATRTASMGDCFRVMMKWLNKGLRGRPVNQGVRALCPESDEIITYLYGTGNYQCNRGRGGISCAGFKTNVRNDVIAKANRSIAKANNDVAKPNGGAPCANRSIANANRTAAHVNFVAAKANSAAAKASHTAAKANRSIAKANRTAAHVNFVAAKA